MYRLVPSSLVMCVGLSPALADTAESSEQRPGVTDPTGSAPGPEHSAAEVAFAPRPGDESGRIDRDEEDDSTLRLAGRGILFVPRLAIDIVLAPVRGAVWAYDRYRLGELYYRVFFNDARTIGLTPTVAYETGYGIGGMTVGARFVDRDMLGAREQLALVAAAGMVYRQLYSAELRSGDRFGKDITVDLDAGFEQRPHMKFYGFGNEMSIESQFRQQRSRLAIRGDARIWDDLHLRGAAAASELAFGPSDDSPAMEMPYDTSQLVGWHGVTSTYGELELRWDSRDHVSRFEPKTFYASGSLASLFGGREHLLAGGNDFWRYGADLQQFVRLGMGPRVLAMRVHGEGVSGSRDEVPFTELPRLGGASYLRGYALDRFRDRVAAFGSAAYEWDLADRVSASMFVDVGRVYDSVEDLSLSNLRVGYGFAIEGHSLDAFWAQASIASSIDGGVMLNLAFNPVFDIDERVRRR